MTSILLLVTLSTALGASPAITLDKSSGPLGTTVTITGTGWDAYKPGPLSSEYYLTLLWVDHQPELNTGIQDWYHQPGLYGLTSFQVQQDGTFELTATIQNGWSGTGYFGVGNENPSTGYLRGIFADAPFTITTGGGGGGGGGGDGNSNSGQQLNADVATAIGVAATGAAVALVAGQRIPLRRKDFGTQTVQREISPETGISYEKPPEAFVTSLNPPESSPEKVSREEVLRDWTHSPDYVKQAWRNYDICQQNAAICQSQIENIKQLRADVALKHRSNITKASLKLALKTTEIIANGVQMGYIDKLARMRELAMVRNSFTQARLIGESMSAIERATSSVSQAQLAYEATIQSAGKLKGLLAEWNQRMSPDYVRPDGLRDAVTGRSLGWVGRSADAREFETARIMTLDSNTQRFIQPAVNRFKQIVESGASTGRSYDDLVKESLEEGVKEALAEMGRREKALESANQAFKSALESANNVMSDSEHLATASEVANLGASGVHGAEMSSSEGGLDHDDPAILAEGQGELERLQNQINWLQKHHQMAIDCMTQNMETIKGYNGGQDN